MQTIRFSDIVFFLLYFLCVFKGKKLTSISQKNVGKISISQYYIKFSVVHSVTLLRCVKLHFNILKILKILNIEKRFHLSLAPSNIEHKKEGFFTTLFNEFLLWKFFDFIVISTWDGCYIVVEEDTRFSRFTIIK